MNQQLEAAVVSRQQFARWLPHSIVPFHPLKCMGSSGEKLYVLSTVHAKVASYFTAEISNQYSIY